MVQPPMFHVGAVEFRGRVEDANEAIATAGMARVRLEEHQERDLPEGWVRCWVLVEGENDPNSRQVWLNRVNAALTTDAKVRVREVSIVVS